MDYGPCECTDPGCTCKGACALPATCAAYRPDIGSDGAVCEFCDDCMADAEASGLFSVLTDPEYIAYKHRGKLP